MNTDQEHVIAIQILDSRVIEGSEKQNKIELVVILVINELFVSVLFAAEENVVVFSIGKSN